MNANNVDDKHVDADESADAIKIYHFETENANENVESVVLASPITPVNPPVGEHQSCPGVRVENM